MQNKNKPLINPKLSIHVFIIAFLGLLSTVFFTYKTYAADVDVLCQGPDVNNGKCIVSGSLFNVTDFVPGQTVLKTIKIENTHKTNACAIKIYTSNVSQDPANLATQFNTSIDVDGLQLIGSKSETGATSDANMQQILNTNFASPISLLNVAKNQSKTLNWVVTFNQNAGNEWQNGLTVFDFNLNFTCDGTENNEDEDNDDDDDDDDNDDDDDDDDNDDDNNNSGSTTSRVLGTASRIFRGAVGGVSTILGSGTAGTTVPEISDTAPEIIEAETENGGEVAGESTESPCIDVWWWWVFLAIQALIALMYIIVISVEDLTKQGRFYTFSIIISTVSVAIYYLYFCPWYDWYLAIGIGIVSLVLIYLKFEYVKDKLKEPAKQISK